MGADERDGGGGGPGDRPLEFPEPAIDTHN